MRRTVHDAIKGNAIDLWQLSDPIGIRLLEGANLMAWRVVQELKLTDQARPIRASEIAQALDRKYPRAQKTSAENVRQICRALQSGGIAIDSARSRGYWINWDEKSFLFSRSR